MCPRHGRVYPCRTAGCRGRAAGRERAARCHTGEVPRLPSVFRVPGAAPVLLACTLFAIYCCVPETSHLPWVALAVASLAGMEYGGHRTMPWWTAYVALLVLWSGWYGGHYRDSALVGAAFAWWPWAVVWVVDRVARRAGGRASVRAGAAAALVGVTASVAVARTGALARTSAPAFVSAAVAVVATVPVLAVVLAAEHAITRRRGGVGPTSWPAARERSDERTAEAARVGAEWRDVGELGSAADDAGGVDGRDQ